VHPRDGDAVLESHQLREHFCAGYDWDVQAAGFDDFGILLSDGGTDDDHFGTGYVLRAVSLEDCGAQAGETLRSGRILEIRPGDSVAEVEQNLGDTAHADATDTDEMNPLNSSEHESTVGREFAGMDSDYKKHQNYPCDRPDPSLGVVSRQPSCHGCDVPRCLGVRESASCRSHLLQPLTILQQRAE